MTVNISYLSPCRAAAEWLETQPDVVTSWNTCHRGDWMMWLLIKLPVAKEVSVTLALRLARSVLHHMPAGEDHPRLAIEAAEKWLAEPTDDTRTAARAAARAAHAVARSTHAAARAADPAARHPQGPGGGADRQGEYP